MRALAVGVHYTKVSNKLYVPVLPAWHAVPHAVFMRCGPRPWRDRDHIPVLLTNWWNGSNHYPNSDC